MSGLDSNCITCAPLVGQTFTDAAGRKRTIDEFGDSVVTANLKTSLSFGSSWTQHHDNIKFGLADIARANGYLATVEVDGLFKSELTAVELARLSQVAGVHKSLHAAIPDLLLQRQAGGNSASRDPYYYEIKTLNKDYAFDGKEGNQVEKRAQRIQKDMRRSLKKKDSQWFGHKDGRTMGPLENRFSNLNFVGLAVGKYGEVSKELSILITAIANHGALVNWKKLNLRSEQVAAGVLHFHLRRLMGLLILKSGAKLLLSRMPLLSGTAKLSAARVRASERSIFGTHLTLFGSASRRQGRGQPLPISFAF